MMEARSFGRHPPHVSLTHGLQRTSRFGWAMGAWGVWASSIVRKSVIALHRLVYARFVSWDLRVEGCSYVPQTNFQVSSSCKPVKIKKSIQNWIAHKVQKMDIIWKQGEKLTSNFAHYTVGTVSPLWRLYGPKRAVFPENKIKWGRNSRSIITYAGP